MEFWRHLAEELESSEYKVRGQKPRPQHWNNYPLARSDFGMSADLNSRDKFIRVGVYCRGEDFEAHYHLLYDQRQEMASELGEELEWEELPGKKVKRIATYFRDTDPSDEGLWPKQMKWLMDHLDRMDKVFRPRLKILNAGDFVDEGPEEG